ncbi:MAG: cache domain-containing protein [Spirochaetaceae bacterium]
MRLPERLRKRLNPYGIKTKLIASFLVLGFVPMVALTLFIYTSYEEGLKRNAERYTREVLNQVDRSIQTYLNDIFRILSLRNNYYVSQYINLTHIESSPATTRFAYRIWEDFNFLLDTKTNLHDIVIVTHDGQAVSSLGEYVIDPDAAPVYRALQDADRDRTFFQPTYYSPHGRFLFSVGKPIIDSGGRNIGVMRMDIDARLFDEVLSGVNLGESGFVAIVDGNGRIVYHPDKRYIGAAFDSIVPGNMIHHGREGHFTYSRGDDTHLVTYHQWDTSDWKFVSVSDRAEIIENLAWLRIVAILALGLGFAAFVVFLSFYLSSVIMNPIRRLQEQMSRVSENDFSAQIRVDSRDEIGALSKSFNQMVVRIRELMNEVVSDQKRIRSLEMSAMQEQIKPHFIYNSLDTILSLQESGETENAMDMVEYLGTFLRTTLSNGNEVIPLRDELTHVESYLQIQKLRYGDRFTFSIDVDPSVYHHEILKLVLQPLVENSLYHGFRNTSHRGHISIVGRRDNDRIVLEIRDNGCGIPKDTMLEIDQVLADGGSESDTQRFFGVRNTHRRIQLSYGVTYGLRLYSDGDGTTAVVTLPGD